MGVSSSDNLTQEISQLKALVGELVQEIARGRKTVGYIPLSKAADSPGIPFGRKKLEALYEAGEVRGFREKGRGRGDGELILDLASVHAYCERRASEGQDDQARARNILKEMRLVR